MKQGKCNETGETEVVEPAGKVDTVACEMEKECKRVRWPADDETATDH